ncbi:MAG: exonuclease SbcCD subunit D [Methanocalculus sp. MSAO_Arc1]|uniref:metallophosphoesterase family protein n=1 Tax=Methanocalculus TaxID=71151 RepID=UPI000FF51657|nr:MULTISPECIES: exonuclease SbcCD subunit D [unclassified Methanocalculus]MCP1662545.1 DNA repair exonuclease SbcCD nuclease subunit [Methanocalculus sp. AMF5]RQD80083.1 MAG: exonuclease SbcCD subunit D [Methanocalculus sp. MSAO_Arc1]
MKIIHIADTHLGVTAFSRIDPKTGMNLREKQIYDNFLSSIEEICRIRPDALLHAGDLFDSVKPRTQAYVTAFEALERLTDAGIPLIMIAGNHSIPKTRYTRAPFSLFEYHPGTIHMAYSLRYESFECGDTIFHLIPNMLNPDQYREAYNDVERSKSHNNVLVTHGLASSITDRRLATVAEHEIDATMTTADFDYIALGHYHSQSQVGPHAWYSGSLEHLTYGEMYETKGGLTVDTARRTVEPLPLPKTPMIDLGSLQADDLTASEIISEIEARIEAISSHTPPMAQITLEGIRKETGRAIAGREMARIREQVLDLRIKSISPDEIVMERSHTDSAFNIQKEFSVFVKGQGLPEKTESFILEKGSAILSSIVEEADTE